MTEWAKEALTGLGKGAPFSLSLTKEHFSRVASARANNDNALSSVSREFEFSFNSEQAFVINEH